MEQEEIEILYMELEKKIQKFISTFRCPCTLKTNFTEGGEYCIHLLKEKKERFREEITQLVQKDCLNKFT